MSEILNQTLSVINHVKTDIENSNNIEDIVIPLNALHSAVNLMGFKDDNPLVIRLASIEQCYEEKGFNVKKPDINTAKKEILQLIEYLIEESKLIDMTNHNE